MGHQSFVGGGYVLPRQDRSTDILIGRMHPADSLHHRVDGSVLQNIIKVVGDANALQFQLPAAQHRRDLHILPVGNQLIDALSHGAEAQ